MLPAQNENPERLLHAGREMRVLPPCPSAQSGHGRQNVAEFLTKALRFSCHVPRHFAQSGRQPASAYGLGERRLKARDRFLPSVPRHDSKRYHAAPRRTHALPSVAEHRLDTARETDHRWSVTTRSPSMPPLELPRRAVSRLTVFPATFGLAVVVRACGDG